MTTLDMSPAVLNIVGVRGGDANARSMRFTVEGQPLDLTGMVVTAQARKKSVDPDPPALTAVIDVIDPVAGEVIISWSGEAVSGLLAGAAKWTGVWDLQVQSGAGALPVTLMAGAFECVSDVTRV